MASTVDDVEPQLRALRQLFEARRWNEATHLLLQALKPHPYDERLWKFLKHFGQHLLYEGFFREGLRLWQTAVDLRPDDPDTQKYVGDAWLNLGDCERALPFYDEALRLRPQFADALKNVGVAHSQRRRYKASRDAYELAIQIRPDYPEAYLGLGVLHEAFGKYEAAERCYVQTLRFNPQLASAHNNLGSLHLAQGYHDRAAAGFRRALELKPSFMEAHTNLLFCEQYRHAWSPAEMLRQAREWDERHAQPFFPRAPQWPNSREPDRALRIGFVSGDLGEHPVGFLMLPILEQMDRTAFETVCYSTRLTDDAVLVRLRKAATLWRDARALDDLALVEQIRHDRIDILFDLAGHTFGHRLIAMAYKPAPIQVSWLGYVGTTGMRAIDYLLTDATKVPPEHDPHYAERVVRLPRAGWCFQLPRELPPLAAPPLLQRGYPTFGSFNNPAKITSEVLDVWSELLRRVPHARLLLKYRGLEERRTQQRLIDGFERCGIDLHRVEFRGHTPLEKMLAEYAEMDVALDPFPFTGGATTMMALTMGVPVVTLAGETMAGRQSLAVLAGMNQLETVAHSSEQYLTIAEGLVAEPARLATLRGELRRRVLASPYCDAPQFVQDFAATIRQLWRDYCRQPS